MPFKKGVTKTGGRQPGVQNKTTVTVKDMFYNVFNELQADAKANLAVWAKANPTEFYKLASKLIPTEIEGSVKVINVIPPQG